MTRIDPETGEQLLKPFEALEYINARRAKPISWGTLRGYISAKESARRAGMPYPDLEEPSGPSGKMTDKYYKTSTLDRWLASRPGPGNWGPRSTKNED